MNTPPPNQNAPTPTSNGVPLGGIGTGYIELGSDGIFRNITINNNRTSASKIPSWDNSFMALRNFDGTHTTTRILRSSVPNSLQGVAPAYSTLSPDEVSWFGLYPSSNFQLKPNVVPVECFYHGFAPVIPYDTEASTLPLIMLVFVITNKTKKTQQVSTLVNWENIRGSIAGETVENRGYIHPISLTDEDQSLHAHDDLARADKSYPIGISYALRESCDTNPEGNYALVVNRHERDEVSFTNWNPDSEEDQLEFWNTFEKHGKFPNTLSHEPGKNCGTLCNSTDLLPGESRQINFILSWYCPTFTLKGQELGNNYTLEFDNSLEVAEYGLKHGEYFKKAISNWQKRFTQSSLPGWYSRMLINSSHVLTTNSILTLNGEFSMMETPEDPLYGMTDRSFYSSIGTLLFYPQYADREMTQLSAFDDTATPGRVFRTLGKDTIREPGHGEGASIQIDINAKFILMAYRNFHMTGKLANLMSIFPRLKKIMEYSATLDFDGDNIPDADGEATTFRGWAMYGLTSYTGSLWIAAMVAYADLTRQLKNEKEARKYEEMAQKALQQMEKRLWNNEHHYYNLYHCATKSNNHPSTDNSCHSGQLVGPWVAEFLKLGGWFPHQRTQAALKSIEKYNNREFGFTKGAKPDGSPSTNPPSVNSETQAEKSWPALESVYVACNHIYYGNLNRGMEILHRIYKNVYSEHKRAFNHPLSWDPVTNQPVGWKHDHHMTSMAMWHSLFALQGFLFSVPRKTISIAPRLPQGVTNLRYPLFTPISFGWLNFEVVTSPAYRQRVLIKFDSPVTIQIIQLNIPKTIMHTEVSIKIGEERVDFLSRIKPNQSYNELNLYLKDVLQIQQSIEISVIKGSPAAADNE
jgi:non-lysosomal glucosylceramidase